MKMKDVEFEKCEEYSPYSERANRYGMVTFWKAYYYGEIVGYGDTKQECKEDVKRWMR